MEKDFVLPAKWPFPYAVSSREIYENMVQQYTRF